MARVHYLQHVPFEGLGCIAEWLAAEGHAVTGTHLYADESLPEVNSLDWLIVMGGPMGVHDEALHPWLAQEKRFIRDCVQAGKTVLGICLGAQLIADVLGGRVTRNPEKEIGWFPIEVTDSGRQTRIGALLAGAGEVLHWHGDTFSIPPGAVHLATSAACANQAFLYEERVLGLQCHLEITPAGAAALCSECSAELLPANYVQTANEILAPTEYFTRINTLMADILAALAPRP